MDSLVNLLSWFLLLRALYYLVHVSVFFVTYVSTVPIPNSKSRSSSRMYPTVSYRNVVTIVPV